MQISFKIFSIWLVVLQLISQVSNAKNFVCFRIKSLKIIINSRWKEVQTWFSCFIGIFIKFVKLAFTFKHHGLLFFNSGSNFSRAFSTITRHRHIFKFIHKLFNFKLQRFLSFLVSLHLIKPFHFMLIDDCALFALFILHFDFSQFL